MQSISSEMKCILHQLEEIKEDAGLSVAEREEASIPLKASLKELVLVWRPLKSKSFGGLFNIYI